MNKVSAAAAPAMPPSYFPREAFPLAYGGMQWLIKKKIQSHKFKFHRRISISKQMCKIRYVTRNYAFVQTEEINVSMHEQQQNLKIREG